MADKVQINITYRDGVTPTSTSTITRDIVPVGGVVGLRDLRVKGLIITAGGVHNAVWYPPHAIVKVEFMGTAPEKSCSDRHEDY
jgi:hypothetical protein